MISTQISVGECPVCGDELYIFRTKTGKRLVKCINDDCPGESKNAKAAEPLIYGIPQKGEIRVTGINCPVSKYPVIAIVPRMKITMTKLKTNEKKAYFWAKGPCFACSKGKNCEEMKELVDEYEIEP